MAEETEGERIAKWDEQVCKALMETPQGRYMVERFLDFCSEGQDLYLNDGDALGMAKRDGMARAGRWWRSKIEEYCPDRYLQMIRERRSRIARANAAVAAAERAAVPEEEASTGLTMMEALADEQQREAIEQETKRGKKK